MARSGTGVVRVAAIPLRIWLFRDRSNHPRGACGRGFPLAKEESPKNSESLAVGGFEPTSLTISALLAPTRERGRG